MRTHIGAATLLFAVTATVVTGCSSSGGTDDKPASALADALGHLQSTPTASVDVEFGRPAAAAAASQGARGTEYRQVSGYGDTPLSYVANLLPDKLGFALTDADYAVTTGADPRQASLLSGLDLGKAAAKLTALGASVSDGSGGGKVYRFRPDNRISASDKLATALPTVVGHLDVVSIDGSQLRHAPSSADLALTDASDSNLLDDDAVADVAACLDDPLAAIILGTLPPGSGSPTKGIALVGAGTSGAKGQTPTEQLCVRADSADDAGTIASGIRTALQSGTSERVNEKWTQLLTAPHVATDDSTVRVTAHPTRGTGGILLSALLQGDLPGVNG